MTILKPSEYLNISKSRRAFTAQACKLVGAKDKEELANRILSKMTLENIQSGSAKVWLDLQQYSDGNDYDTSRLAIRKTTLWLTEVGFKDITRRLDKDKIEWLVLFMDYWEGSLLEHDVVEPEKSEINNVLPTVFDWGTYLLLRGPVPKDFPFEGYYWYAIQRVKELNELASMRSKPNEYLERALENIHTRTVRELHKLNGEPLPVKVDCSMNAIHKRANKYVKQGIPVQEALSRAWNEYQEMKSKPLNAGKEAVIAP